MRYLTIALAKGRLASKAMDIVHPQCHPWSATLDRRSE